jgi:glutathione S-transferase
MILVYGGWPTRSQRILWLLEEMGLPYELRLVDLRLRREDAEFIAVNPSGFLPVLKDGDVSMIESIAMIQYLGARYGPSPLVPAPDDPVWPAFLQFLHLGEASLAAYLNPVVATAFLAPAAERDNYGVRAAKGLFFNRLALVETQLEGGPHLAGEAFTAADISVHYALEMGARLGLSEEYGPAVKAYAERLTARPAYQRALAKSPPRPLGPAT